MIHARPPALLVAFALLAAAPLAGCTTTVKSKESRFLTQEEAAEAEAQRRKAAEEEKAKKGAEGDPAKEKRATTVDGEIERLRAKLVQEPRNAGANFELGRLYETQGKLTLAEERYRNGTSLLPLGDKDRYTGPHYFLGRVLWKQSAREPAKLEEAKRELTLATQVKPDNPEMYFHNPDFREAYFLLGVIEHTRKNEDAARLHFKKFLGLGGERDHVVQFYPDMIAE